MDRAKVRQAGPGQHAQDGIAMQVQFQGASQADVPGT